MMSVTRRLAVAVAVLGLATGQARADMDGTPAGADAATVAMSGLLMAGLAMQGWWSRAGRGLTGA